MDLVDWGDRVGKYNIESDWWKVQKAEYPANVVSVATTDYNALEKNQRLTYDTIVSYFEDALNNREPEQLLLYIDGKVGSGKTTVVNALSAWIDALAAENNQPSPIFKTAPTGVAACNFGGCTLYLLLWLPVKEKTYQPLSPGNLKTL
jgi:ATP-dependent DNA helicase PIF1